MPLDDVLDLAVDGGQRSDQQRHARHPGRPTRSANRSAPLRPPLPANRSAISICRRRACSRRKSRALDQRQEDASRLMLTIRVGGSTESDDTE